MSKYLSLWKYLIKNLEEYLLTFDEIKDILGFEIDLFTYKKELKEFGYNVSKISIKNKTVKFIKI